MATLRISSSLALPAEAVTEAIGWVGNRSSGKTYGAKVMAEEMLKAGAQVVVLDPVDAWYGLRWGQEAGTPGLPVYVFGGAHGDVALEAEAGALLANVVVEQGVSAVFSLRHLSKGRQRRFVAEFAEQLYLRKGEDQYRTPVHVFIEEAHTFAPQTMVREDYAARCLGAIQDLVLQGRSSGIGVSLVTQRVAVLSKAVLELAEVLCAFRTTGPNARKALRTWFDAHDDEDSRISEFVNGVPSLPRGECWVWSPGYLNVFQRATIRRAETFDSSATPPAGKPAAKPKGKAAALDLDALGAEISETRERAKANDPKTLRSQIKELEAKLAAAEQHRPEPERVVETVEVPTLPPEALAATRAVVNGAMQFLDTIGEGTETLRAQVDHALSVLTEIPDRRPPDDTHRTSPSVRPPAPRGEARSGSGPSPRAAGSAAPRGTQPPAGDDDYRPRAGARRMLVALAQFPAGLTKAQLGTTAKVKKSGGTFSTYVSELRAHGLLVVESDGRFVITDLGLEHVGEVAPIDPEHLIESWRERLGGTGNGARRMFDVLVEQYPGWLSKDTLAEEAEITLSGGTYSTYLSRLTTNGLAEVDAGTVRASPTLFLA